MMISKNFFCECIIRNYALKELGWADYFELEDFPVEEAEKNHDLAVAMNQLGLIEYDKDPLDGVNRSNCILLHVMLHDGELDELSIEDIIHSLPDEGTDILSDSYVEEKILYNKKNFSVKKCKKCGKFFIGNAKTVYCSRLNKEGVPCYVNASVESFKEKENNDEFLKAYHRAYKTHHARMKNTKRKKMTPEEFSRWHSEARYKLTQARNGFLSLDEFKKWLKI